MSLLDIQAVQPTPLASPRRKAKGVSCTTGLFRKTVKTITGDHKMRYIVEDSALWVVAVCEEKWMAEAIVEAAARVEHSKAFKIRLPNRLPKEDAIVNSNVKGETK